MKKLLLLSGLLLFMVSCESDSAENTTAALTGYKITIQNDNADPSMPDYGQIVTGILQNGKLFSETAENLVNGVVQGSPATVQHFFYSNNRLDQRVSQDKTVYYYYNANGGLIGATAVFALGGTLHERYVHQPNNVVYCESLNLPYNDPNVVASSRRILQLDANGNVISGGRDFDMDGVASDVHTYTYSNGNLTAVHNPDGSVVNFTYAGVINTRRQLEEFSCGKQVLQFPCAFVFADGSADAALTGFSKYLTTSEFSEAVFEVMPDGFYNKRTFSNPSASGTYTHELEYFFN